MLLNCGVGEDFWESLGLQGDQTSQSNPKGNQPRTFMERADAEADTPILWPPDVKGRLIRKEPDAGKDRRQEEKGMTEDVMVGWHHWLNGHEFESTLREWRIREPGMLQSMEQLNSNNIISNNGRSNISGPMCLSRTLSLPIKKQNLFLLFLNLGRTLWLTQWIGYRGSDTM